MRRLPVTLSFFLAACSPPIGKPETKPAPAAEQTTAPAVPFPKLGWAENRFTWEGQPFTGVTTDHSKDGTLKLRYHLKDGVYHGLVEEWYPNGNRKTKTNYKNGRHEGDNFYWNPDGSLQAHKVWKDDQLVSEDHADKAP
jgi:hypothetical protein